MSGTYPYRLPDDFEVRHAAMTLDDWDIIEGCVLAMAIHNDEAARNGSLEPSVRDACKRQAIAQYMLLERLFGHPDFNRKSIQG